MSLETEPDSAANDDATVVGRPGARSRSGPPDSGIRLAGPTPGQPEGSSLPSTMGGSSSTGAGLNEVLEAEEAMRAHGFSAVMSIVSLCVATFIPWLPG